VIGASGADFAVESVIDVGDGPAGQAADRLEPVLVAPSDGAVWSLALPMLAEDRLIGVLAMNATPGRAFSEYQRLVLELFADCAAPWVASAVSEARAEMAAVGAGRG